MTETIIQAKTDELIQLVLESAGKPPFDYRKLATAMDRVDALLHVKAYPDFKCEEIFATDIAVAVVAGDDVPTVEVPEVHVVKRTRRSKEQIAADEIAAAKAADEIAAAKAADEIAAAKAADEIAAAKAADEIAAAKAADEIAAAKAADEIAAAKAADEIAAAKAADEIAAAKAADEIAAAKAADEIAAAKAKAVAVVETPVAVVETPVAVVETLTAGATHGEEFIFKFPSLAGLTKVEEPQKLISDHKAPLEVVQAYAKRPKMAQLEKGNIHGNSLAKAAIRSLGGARISEVAPAKWGKLIDLFVAITDADIPDTELESTDDAGYDKLLAAITAQAVEDDEL